MERQKRTLTPGFKDFLAESAIQLPFDYLVFRCPGWLQNVIEKHLPWLLDSGYFKARDLTE